MDMKVLTEGMLVVYDKASRFYMIGIFRFLSYSNVYELRIKCFINVEVILIARYFVFIS